MKKIVSILLSVIIGLGAFMVPGTAEAAAAAPTAGIISTSSGRLNVRSSRSTSAPVVASLNKGSYVTLLSRSGSWWYVEYAKGQYGYSHADYIKTAGGSAAVVRTQSGNLNVRSGAGTSYAVQDRLAKGESVVVLSTSGGWSRILYHGTKLAM